MMTLITTIIVYTCSAYSVVIHALKPEDATSSEPVSEEVADPLKVSSKGVELSPLLISMDSAATLVLSETALAAEYSTDIVEPEGFNFPDSISEGARIYLEEAYNQALEASEHTMFPDPFMSLSLAVVEKPVENHEVFRIPLVSQELLNRALTESGGDYSAAIAYSNRGHSYGNYDCVGPLQMAVGWVVCERRDPTIWKDSVQMFHEDAELAVPGMIDFAEKCDITVTDELLMTLVAMRHNVGNLADWGNSNPDSSPNRKFIPFKTKRSVYTWNEAVASEKAQKAIKKAAYEAYLDYLETGVYENQGIGWKEIAKLTGYPQSNITSTKQWWRPLYSVRFWFNYYQLQLLYGVETPASLGI